MAALAQWCIPCGAGEPMDERGASGGALGSLRSCSAASPQHQRWFPSSRSVRCIATAATYSFATRLAARLLLVRRNPHGANERDVGPGLGARVTLMS